jgi:arsenate reductase-like glutaredoxin family protein
MHEDDGAVGFLLRLDANGFKGYTPHVPLQIFGTRKSSDTRKAERFFKERRVTYQFIDLAEKGISPGELRSVRQAVVGADPKAWESLIND